MPRALITGITGQDGLYLGEFLFRFGAKALSLVPGLQYQFIFVLRPGADRRAGGGRAEGP